MPPSKDVLAYLEHLDRIAAQDPVLLLAHAYTQYMALTAGGQIIQRMVRRAMSLPEDKGTAAFTFTVCCLRISLTTDVKLAA